MSGAAENTTGTAYISMQDREKFQDCADPDSKKRLEFCSMHNSCSYCPLDIKQEVWDALNAEWRIKRELETL